MKTERKTETCPYCGNERPIPIYAFAHWSDLFTVTCGNQACGKKYSFFKGETMVMPQPRKKRMGNAKRAGQESTRSI